MSHPIVQALVLAAGESSRFGTKKSKLSFLVCGEPMVTYPIRLLSKLKIDVTVVVGFQEKIVKGIIANCGLPNISFIEQKERLGTGHALMQTKPIWNTEHILVLNGDIPLVNENTISALIKKHKTTRAALSFVTAHGAYPAANGYGRVLMENGEISIVEARNFTADTKELINVVNAGIYIIKRDFLEENLGKLKPNKKTGEIYITDLIRLASKNGKRVITTLEPFDSIRGVNTLEELNQAEKIKRSEIIANLMTNGIRFTSPENSYIDLDIEIGEDSFIGPNTTLLKGTKIGAGSQILGSSVISNSTIGKQVNILPFSVIKDSVIHDGSTVGPFAHLRNGTIMEENSAVGNFVETKKCIIGKNSKAKHLSYLGDTTIQENVNIGAGTITCNYDGYQKHKTIIEAGAFIGSNNAIVAPLTIGKNSITAAGSTLTEDVPENSLAIGRTKQINKENYANKMRIKLTGKSCDETIVCAKSKEFFTEK